MYTQTQIFTNILLQPLTSCTIYREIGQLLFTFIHGYTLIYHNSHNYIHIYTGLVLYTVLAYLVQFNLDPADALVCYHGNRLVISGLTSGYLNLGYVLYFKTGKKTIQLVFFYWFSMYYKCMLNCHMQKCLLLFCGKFSFSYQ